MRDVLRIAFTAAAVALLASSPVRAADSQGPMYVNPGSIKWSDGPPGLPKGAKVAALLGDPGKEGMFVVRMKMPANYRVPPHWHSQDEDLTIISGTLYLAEGDKPDTRHAHAMNAGAFHHLPAKTHHFAFSKKPTIVQIHGMGPFDINYVNPADDPGRMMAKH